MIAGWSGGVDNGEAVPSHGELSVAGLKRHLSSDEASWRCWYDEYEETRKGWMSQLPGGEEVPEPPSWSKISRVLVDEVFPFVRLRVVNSDPDADDRPGFKPVQGEEGPEPAPDLLSIFVSGNVMSRGVTLEGLTTSVFLRPANSPAADTQMQMQRWFGYRGAHLHLCRVFLDDQQLELFKEYHGNDETLRTLVLNSMNGESQSAPSPLVLQRQGYVATRKIANLRTLPLWPGPTPFIPMWDIHEGGDRNLVLLGDLLERDPWEELRADGELKGLISSRSLSLVEAAELLESLRFEQHNPDPDSSLHRRWQAQEVMLKLDAPVGPLFRPQGDRTGDAVDPASCPYSIAAYLRLWAAALTRPSVGYFPTDDYRTRWSMVNLSEYAALAPQFRIGIRFGPQRVASEPRLKNAGVRMMTRAGSKGAFSSTWGTRIAVGETGPYFGDQFFDYHCTKLIPQFPGHGESSFRPRGHPGLILFHPVVRADGTQVVGVGLGIPLGGPDHYGALTVQETAQRRAAR